MSQTHDLNSLHQRAGQGDLWAQTELGIMYGSGQVVAQDDVQAVAWYRKAAERRYAPAQNNLGFMYDSGRGVAQDDVQAVAWYRKAAEQGHALGQANLGLMYKNGRGVAQDDIQAAAWCRKAAEQGNAWAQTELGIMYHAGRGVAQDDVQAAAWYRKAAEQGYASGQNNLGSMHENGTGVAKDSEQARRWYEAALTNPEALEQNCAFARRGLERLNGKTSSRPGLAVPATPHAAGASAPDAETVALTLEEALGAVEAMIGLDSVKDELRDLADYVSVQKQRRELGLKTPDLSLHLVFTGNPGTGKTTVARHVGAIYRAMGLLKSGHVVEVKREDLVGEYLGQTAPKTKAKIEEALDGVLFVDEAYTLSPAKLSYHDYGTEAIATLLAEMENNRSRLAVIVAGYTDEMSVFIGNNPGLKSRFTRYIEFPDYTPENLTDIFQSMAADGDYVVTDALRTALLSQLGEMYAARAKDFGNGRSARNLYEKVLERHGRRVARLKKPGRDVLTMLTVEDLTGQAGPSDEKPVPAPQRQGQALKARKGLSFAGHLPIFSEQTQKTPTVGVVEEMKLGDMVVDLNPKKALASSYQGGRGARNAPCSCASGKKFKHCCGAI